MFPSISFICMSFLSYLFIWNAFNVMSIFIFMSKNGRQGTNSSIPTGLCAKVGQVFPIFRLLSPAPFYLLCVKCALQLLWECFAESKLHETTKFVNLKFIVVSLFFNCGFPQWSTVIGAPIFSANCKRGKDYFLLIPKEISVVLSCLEQRAQWI